MRPNVDIPWSLHGEVKEYGERHGEDIESAYRELLRKGLSATQDRTSRFKEKSGGEVHFSKLKETVGVGTVVTFSDFGRGGYEEPTVIRTNESNVPIEEVDGILSSLAKQFPLDNGDFAIHQKNCGWYGEGGISDFAYWLDNLRELYESTPEDFVVDRHRAASAAFIAPTAYPAGHIIVYASPNGHGKIEKFGIEFVVDGYLIEAGQFGEFADDVGLALSHIFSWNKREDEKPLEEGGQYPETETVDDVLRTDIGDIVTLREKLHRTEEKHIVEGIITENPFYETDEIERIPLDNPELATVLSGTEVLPARLTHTVDEDMNYELFVNRFSLTDLRDLTRSPFNIVSINYQANW